ncbi:MAG: DMT family transporter, partial [Dehalococcoidales bacterium]|nr:DMT family transporter [Dehalococcoidales bacterium]
MSWQVLIGVSVILYSVSVLLQRILLKDDKSDPVSFSIFFQITVAAVTAILIMIFKGKIILPNFSEISWSILVMTFLYALANVFIFKSLKEIEASRFTVIFSSKTLIAVLGASLFFKENLNYVQWIGALFIVGGVIVISIKNIKLKLGKGDILAFAAAVFFGLANTNDRYLVKFFDPYSYVVIGFLLPGILIAAFNPKKISKLKIYFDKSIFYKMILLCGLYGMSAVAFFAALQNTPNSSQVFAINAFTGVLTVVFA